MSEFSTHPWTGQTAIVTGAGSGIGAAIARSVAQLGATVYLLGRRLNALEAVAGEIRAGGGKAQSYEIDITQDPQLLQFQQTIVQQIGQVDLLIHSAGVFAMADMKTAPLTDLDRQYQTNVRAPYALTQLLLPLLVSDRSQIVFINSTAGLSSKAGVGQYSATKHALKAIADSLRSEVNPEGIRVISVFPGRTATPMQAEIFAQEGRAYNPATLLQPEDVAHMVVSALQLPRSAEVTDINIRGMVKMG